MRILSIETSADETAVSVVEATGEFPDASYEILGNGLHSQIELHTQYGGIFPAMAKREHARAILPLMQAALTEAEILETGTHNLNNLQIEELSTLLYREPELLEVLLEFFKKYDQPQFDLIAVTSGPGLEPALWVGVNFARALALIWDVPIVPVNHMEGHVLASVYDVERDDMLAEITFPTIALLISGGHTELIVMRDWGEYEKIGQTRDDAVGEAFDKVARLLGLPYPGGPAISKRAATARKKSLPEYAALPSPMLNTKDFDFSFSGLKTAVRYAVVDKELSEDDICAVARDFEDAVTKVLLKKTLSALFQYGASTLVVGGGVSANTHIKRSFEMSLLSELPDVTSYFPKPGLSTDNSVMIALAGHARAASKFSPRGASAIRADGNKSLDKTSRK